MRRPAATQFRDRLPWYLLAGTFVVVAVLVGASLANYNAVAQVQVETSLYPTYTAAFPSGSGPYAFTLHLAVDNPSSRTLLFNTIGYKVWIEDLQAEAGLVHVPRGDVPGPNGTLYFPVFAGSVQVDPSPVPPGANVTYLYTLNLTTGNNPTAYAIVSDIVAYARTQNISADAIPWIFWTLVSLDIDGVPAPSAYSAADYLLNLGRVALTGGEDLSP